ncbi:MAG: AAA family ATPase [Chloroflexota bacterium]|nr:AAA family ATPase [Chloroflexota bacterium]
MSRTVVLLLGPPRIERHGAPVDVDTRKAVALVAYLAVTRQRHRRDALAALLWPDYEEGRAALRRTLSALNKALGEGCLIADRESVGLNGGGALCVDADRFDALLAQVRTHAHHGSEICPACLSALDEAVRLYRDDFLAGFTLRDSPEFDDWQFFQAESRRRDLAGALEQISRARGGRGEFDEAIAYARRWLALDPLHEPAHVWLMDLYASAGQHAAALRQYRTCAQVLQEELGVAPLEETTRLYQALKENRAAPPVSTRSPQTPASPIRQAPPLPSPEPPARQFDHPLVGRSGEWERLLAAYDRAASGHVALVEGEAGIGKTRLAEEFLAHARAQGAVTLTARCYEGEANLAFGPFVAVLGAAVGALSSSGRLEQLPPHVLSETARLVPELAGLRPGLPSAPPLDNPGAQARFFEGIAQILLATIDDGQPGVLFVDDAHWADAASLDLLAYLIRRPRERLLVLLAVRGEQAAGPRLHHLLADARRAGAGSAISLSRLSRASVEDLVRTKVAVMPSSSGVGREDLARRLHEETEGLPLFLSEYLAAMGEGLLSSDDAAWDLPGGVRDLLRARLATVSEGSGQLLQAAAVIGRSFDYGAVQAASGRDEEMVVTALEELIGHGIIKEVRGRPGEIGGHPTYDFSHEKFRALVYDETSLARRRLLHRRVADALAGRARTPRDAGALAGQIAHHYRQAGQDAVAAAYFVAAGEHARSLYANLEALRDFQAALALGHPEPAGLHEAIGDLQALCGAYVDALASYETAAALSRPQALARLEHKLGQVYHRRGEWDLAERSFEAAETALGGTLAPAEQSPLYADWSLMAHHRGRSRQARALAEQALRLAEQAADDRALAQAHNVLGILAGAEGETATARRHLERSVALAEKLNDPGARAAALNNLALACGAGGEIERAMDLTEAALALTAARGDRHRQAALHNNLADLLHAAGRSEEALAHVKEAVTIYVEIGVEAGAVQPHIWKLTEW